MLYFLVGIVVLAFAIYIYILIAMNSNRKRIRILEARQLELANHPQDDKIQKIDALGLSGGSLNSYQKWAQAYQTLTTKTFDQINDDLGAAQDHNSLLRFYQSKRDITKVESALGNAEKQMADVSEAFDKILEKAKENERQVAELRTQYDALRKQLLTQSFAFGEALPALENQLTAIESAFDKAEQQKNSSDFLEEQTTLASVAKQLKDLEANMISIRPLYAQIVNSFTSQLDEQQKGFDILRKQQYQFPGFDVPGEIAKLRRFQMQTLQILAQLAIPTAKKRNEDQSKAIDRIYDVMQTEIDSHQFVEAEQDRLSQFMGHAAHQNNNLLDELDHLDQSYILNHDEMKTAAGYKQTIGELQGAFDQDIQAITEKRAVYSIIADNFKRYRNELKKIETVQIQIHNKLADLYKGEQMALESLKEFEVAMRNIKRRVTQFNLPGLPKKYLDFYYVVTDEIKQLHTDLDQVKIDLDAITKQLILTSDDIDKLKQQTEDLIDAASIGQQLLQYANKYRNENTDVANAVSDATRLFNIDYDYPAALDKVSSVIENVEPGAYKQIEDSYYKHKTDALI
ncbi:septation ring formation regulator EzrA [Agrilactobacillus composti]|uniref:septation ring formation regulator EzrA n=1 Tax=Agrilactobacillus composti TaxID=398555 RepID=UPI0007051E45|nr:septation ring formation regulator EzrA [Agrilactobacillus composti]